VATSQQVGTPFPQTDVFVVDKSGTTSGDLNVWWVVNGGTWSGPQVITSGQNFNPGTHLAASEHFGASSPRTDVFAVNKFGALTVTWVVGGGTWQQSVEISPRGKFPAGAPVAASGQYNGTAFLQTDVFVVDTTGRLNVFWAVGGGDFTGNYVFPDAIFVPGANVAASAQVGASSPQTDVFAVDTNGNVQVYWAFNLANWSGPYAITSGGFGLFDSGAALATSPQWGTSGGAQTDVFAVDKSGNVQVLWVVGGGDWAVHQITSGGLFASGISLAASPHYGVFLSQTDVLAINKGGHRTVFWVIEGGNWEGPGILQ
jgi:hypothetical protein